MRSIGIDDDLWADVHTIARAHGEGVSSLIRRLLFQYRQENASTLVAARAEQSELVSHAS
jgi:negative regulator of replication initiation